MIYLRSTLLILIFIYCGNVYGQKLKAKHWKSLYEQGTNYLNNDSVQKAWPYLKDAYLISKTHHNQNSKYKQTLLSFFKASVLNNKLEIIDSMNLTDQIIMVSKSLKKPDQVEFSRHLDTIAQGLFKRKAYNEAIQIYNESKRILESNGTTKDEYYANVIFNLGKSYKGLKSNNEKAELLLNQASQLVTDFGPFDQLKQDAIFMEMLSLYISMNAEEKTNATIQGIRDYSEVNYGESSQAHGIKLLEIGAIYFQYQMFDKVYDFQTEAIAMFEAIDYIDNMDYLRANYFLALAEQGKNNYIEAIDAFKKVQKGFIGINATHTDNYARVLGNIALNYDKSGDYENAIRYCDLALEVRDIKTETKCKRLMDKGYYYQFMGQFQLSHKLYNKAKNCMEVEWGLLDTEYSKLLNNIGKLYIAEGNVTEALSYFKTALEIIERPETETWHPFYSYMLNDYATTLFELGRMSDAISIMERNVAYFETNDLEKNESYYNRKSSLAKAYNSKGDFQLALPLIQEATQNLRQILGEDHADYGQFLDILSDTYLGLGQTDLAIDALQQSNQVFIDQIDKIFRFSSEQEKKQFLNMITIKFNRLQSIALTHNLDNPSLNQLNLNNQLLLKGLLLNNSKDILVDLKALKDDVIDRKIRAYKNLKDERTQALTQYSKEGKLLADSLNVLVNEKEAELVKLHSKHHENNTTLVRNWGVIKNNLKPNEVAIEFAHFNVIEKNIRTQRIAYVAYVIEADKNQPTLVQLFEEKELNAFVQGKGPNELYNDEALYSLLWKPLHRHVKQYATIYYAPSGLLNQIAFSAIEHQGKPIVLDHDLFQLSSTYKITEPKSSHQKYSTLLLGGITYDYKSDVSGSAVVSANAQSNSFLSKMNNKRGTKSRGESWTFLEGSLKEIDNLNQLLSSKGTNVTVFKGSSASEEAFKNLSGDSPHIIHIATHGYFYENLDIDVEQVKNLSVEDQYRLADDPLLRSGLILAGANYVWKNGSNPFEKEDGILTALEISNLDLSNTNLVVLSACETGLGDIDGSEGVYGLQRAFKMAGVERLIMSLWEVPDQETALFMKTFYSYWLEGNSERDAFVSTQRDLHKLYPNSPSNWAAFVLFE